MGISTRTIAHFEIHNVRSVLLKDTQNQGLCRRRDGSRLVQAVSSELLREWKILVLSHQLYPGLDH